VLSFVTNATKKATRLINAPEEAPQVVALVTEVEEAEAAAVEVLLVEVQEEVAEMVAFKETATTAANKGIHLPNAGTRKITQLAY
jgi:hypothetical protein